VAGRARGLGGGAAGCCTGTFWKIYKPEVEPWWFLKLNIQPWFRIIFSKTSSAWCFQPVLSFLKVIISFLSQFFSGHAVFSRKFASKSIAKPLECRCWPQFDKTSHKNIIFIGKIILS
jgi:hypothetical protein